MGDRCAQWHQRDCSVDENASINFNQIQSSSIANNFQRESHYSYQLWSSHLQKVKVFAELLRFSVLRIFSSGVHSELIRMSFWTVRTFSYTMWPSFSFHCGDESCKVSSWKFSKLFLLFSSTESDAPWCTNRFGWSTSKFKDLKMTELNTKILENTRNVCWKAMVFVWLVLLFEINFVCTVLGNECSRFARCFEEFWSPKFDHLVI